MLDFDPARPDVRPDEWMQAQTDFLAVKIGEKFSSLNNMVSKTQHCTLLNQRRRCIQDRVKACHPISTGVIPFVFVLD